MHNQYPKGTWQYQEAKAKLSQVMDETQRTGMQIIIRNGKEKFVVLSKDKFDEYAKPKSSLIDFFLKAPYPNIDIDIQRGQDLPREFDL